ncbi:Cof-type HAD-IIB family hydrolase [Alkalicoccobacillus murimartini]|uniref:HAD superfamily hydrolase (TIGR01484 family) n=1 Tax=Alkalicoccobacillus murimartini TaxID=171685 RepID=A0ABT9YI32_9BACI|nr:Cof-type HAD-IIB family hydrolase [Alkalicoccobacillus murimartini]MDQ0207150.1 HAD superfamily hydrolase (TIGR01484 family) [Alkalicoccobacillus murimartini]
MTTDIEKKEIKLVALDIDGTLLDSKHELSEENMKAIAEAQAQGVYVVLSTGRSLMTCSEYAKTLNLGSYLVTVNGSEIWDTEGKLVERNKLESHLVQKMWDLSNEHGTHAWATAVGEVWRNEMPEDIHATEWLKFGFDVQDDVIRHAIQKELESHAELEISNSSPTNLEINAAGINKARGLEKVCGYLGLTMDQVMSVGDSLNDLAMIKEAGIGVAMGNAQDFVKDHADWITLTNDEAGVASAIRKWVLS